MPPVTLLRLICVAVFAAFAAISSAQNLLTNGGFETGTSGPVGWRLEGVGAWTNDPAFGSVITIQGDGDGNSSGTWRSESVSLVPGGLYRFQYAARRQGGGGGSVISGISRVNRDFTAAAEWTTNRFIFSAPHGFSRDYARLGQWHLNGTVVFDDVALHPVSVSHLVTADGIELGEAESIVGGEYRFAPSYGWAGANYHRTLLTNVASFNTDRWMFSPGAEVVYRLGSRGLTQRSARLDLSVNHYVAGTLLVDASADGVQWQRCAEFGKDKRSGAVALPAGLFPAEFVFIRLRAEGAGAALQVNRVDYAAPLAKPVADAIGESHFLVAAEQSGEVAVGITSVCLTNAATWQVTCEISNRSSRPLELIATLASTAVSGANGISASANVSNANASHDRIRLASGESRPIALHAPALRSGSDQLRVEVSDANQRPLFRGETEVDLYFLSDPRAGYWVAESARLGIWWCESGWKIGPERGLPQRPAANTALKPVKVSAARGEYEPAQVILRPGADGTITKVEVSPLVPGARPSRAQQRTSSSERNGTGEPDPANAITVQINEIAYVPVTKATDGTGKRGLHPDPLPPLQTPLALRAGINQGLWLTFHVASNASPGDYTGTLKLTTTLGSVDLPLRVQVYDFALPRETHLRSAFGLSTREINRYHGLTNQRDKELVYDKYLKNFAEHRISPYSFYEYAPIDVRFTGSGTNKRAQVDFTRFDAAATKWLGPDGFSTFQLRLVGMGGGTFHSRSLGRLEGFEEGTPEHSRLFGDYLSQVERHLRDRGWIDKAFTYWFDEPDPKDYEFVVAGMKRIKAAAPGIKRMLTEQPEPELLGHVDIWCGLTPEWTPEKVRARRAAGEQVWWYLCTGPKAPYVTIFIDHPGTEMRLWPWQSWQYGVQALLVWESCYWTSGAAFPAPKLQDPWADPMSYVSGYDFKPGHVGYWGNGDGRFLYPPRRDPNGTKTAIITDPVTSVRWENLRDGMEDYEYFWLLDQALQRARKSGADAGLLREAEALLAVPNEISIDLTHFTTDPRPMLEHRDRVARVIERLQRQRR